MKKNISKTGIVSALAAAALLAGPLSAFALTVDATGAASANTSVSGSANGGSDASSAGSNTTSSANGSVNAGADVSGSAGAGTDATGQSTGATGSGESGSASMSGNGSLELEANGDGVVIRQSGQVASEGDLRVFSDNAGKMDANVRDVDASSGSEIKVDYAHAGRLLGFIPVKVTSETDVSVDADGNAAIKTRMPWWNFLVTRTHQIQNDVDTYLSASLKGSAQLSADASAAERARIVESIIRAHSSLEAGASANANGSVQQY